MTLTPSMPAAVAKAERAFKANRAIANWRAPSTPSIDAAVASGVDPEALALWMSAMADQGDEARLVSVFVEDLRRLRPRWPHLALRDACAWIVSPLWVNPPDSVWGWRGFAHVGIEPWETAGLLDDGWRYARAGLGVNETLAALAAGTLTRESATVLAVLRGPLTVPVG
jgi:hypothetical protein